MNSDLETTDTQGDDVTDQPSAQGATSTNNEQTGITLSLLLPSSGTDENQTGDPDLASYLGSDINVTVIGAAISEGLSRPYEASLQLLANKVLTPDDENKIIDSPCRLCISQSSNTRYLSGIIGAVAYEKQVYSADDSYYLYNLEIICPLDALKFSGQLKTYLKNSAQQSSDDKSQDYENLNVIDTVRALFQRCGFAKITCPLENDQSQEQNPDNDAPSLSDYGTNKVIAQGDVSDYEYLQRLLVLNGLNYNFIHSQDSFYPEVYLTPLAAFDKENSKEVTISSSSGKIVFLDFSLRRQSSKLSSQFEPGYRELYSYLDNLGDDVEDIEVAKFYLQNLKNTLTSRTEEGKAAGSDVRLLCGNAIEISDFYPSSSLSLKIESLQTLCTAPPVDLALPGIPMDNQIQQELLLMSIDGIKTPGSRAVCRGPGLIGYFESLKAHPAFCMRQERADPVYAPGTGLRTIEAVVCNEDGSTKPGTADSYDDCAAGPVPSVFYALPSGSGEVIKVKALSLLNGNGNGLFALPRVGEKILVLSSGSQYYLLGFLRASGPYGADDFVYGSSEHDADLAKLRRPGTVNSSRWSFSDLSDTTSDHVNSYSIGFESIGDQAAYFKSCAFDNSLSLLIDKLQVENNSKKYKTTYELYSGDVSDAASEFTKAKKNYETAQNAYAQEPTVANLKKTADAVNDFTKKSEAFDEAVNKLVTDVNAVTAGINGTDDSSSYKTPRLKLYASEGNVEVISPAGRFDVRAENSTSNVSGTMVLKGKKVVINADDSLKLSVGGNVISLDHNSISIKSQKWTAVNGILDARISMDGLSGISMNGMKVTGTGFLGASLSDAFGGKVSLSHGTLAAKGVRVSITTPSKFDISTNLVQLAEKITQEIATLATAAAGTTADSAEAICYGVSDSINEICKIITFTNDYKTSAEKEAVILVTGILDIISTAASVIITTCSKADSSYWSQYINKQQTVTNLDAAKMALLIWNLSLTATFFCTIIPLLSKSVKIDTGGNIKFKAEELKEVDKTNTDAQSPLVTE